MFGSLRSVPPSQILSSTDSIIAQDRRLTLRLLEHLHEIDRRKLYLESGFASTFDYCTKHLRLSEPSAARRIRTARCVARFPELYPLLESGELNLTVVSMVSKYLKPGNVDEIIARIKSRPKREVEKIVAEYEPKAAVSVDRVRMMVVPVMHVPDCPVTPVLPPSVALRSIVTSAPETSVMAVPGSTVIVTSAVSAIVAQQSTVTGDSEISPKFESTNSKVCNATNQTEASAPASVSKHIEFERLARIEFTAHEALMSKLERVRSIAAHRLPADAPLECLISFMAEYFLESEDPARRQARREARATEPETGETPSSAAKPRYIPVAVRDQVFVRDNQCTYVSPGGHRCGSTHMLQIDHIKPVARGGASTIDNLRILCAYHNRLESERLMGKRGPGDVIREKRPVFGACRSRYHQSVVDWR